MYCRMWIFTDFRPYWIRKLSQKQWAKVVRVNLHVAFTWQMLLLNCGLSLDDMNPSKILTFLFLWSQWMHQNITDHEEEEDFRCWFDLRSEPAVCLSYKSYEQVWHEPHQKWGRKNFVSKCQVHCQFQEWVDCCLTAGGLTDWKPSHIKTDDGKSASLCEVKTNSEQNLNKFTSSFAFQEIVMFKKECANIRGDPGSSTAGSPQSKGTHPFVTDGVRTVSITNTH